jgi:secreted Zn-dependent insulinase-like peptidase
MIVRRLANGLRVHAITQPGAQRAAALVRIETGSYHEPDAWPGLAHLLEHTLFAESARYRDQQRLMPWVQRQGGQLNATTRGEQTAFFFEVGSGRLADGLARLHDMLSAPAFPLAAIQAETAAIDAEYGLLKRHGETLREAATLLACIASMSVARPPSAKMRRQSGPPCAISTNVITTLAICRCGSRDRKAKKRSWR